MDNFDTGDKMKQAVYSGATLKQKLFTLFLLTLAVIAVFGPVTFSYYLNPMSDYYSHSLFALKAIVSSQFLFPLLMLITAKLIPNNDIFLSGIIVVILFHIMTAIVVYLNIVKDLYLNLYASVLLTICLLLAGPIILLALVDGHLYFGYLGINVFHNPTIILLKPFALLVFFSACKIFDETSQVPMRSVISTMLFTILSVLVKPSFLICLLPALAIAVFYQLYRNQPVKWRLLIVGIVAPAIIILAMQYLMTFGTNQLPSAGHDKSSIIIAPFVVMGAMSTWLFPKFILSALFPIMVLICYFKAAHENLQLKFAWLLFLFGVIFTYFFAESGPRMAHGNFGWSGQISLFVLFVLSARFFLNQAPSGKMGTFFSEKKNLLCAAVFCLHVVSNMIFYRAELIRTIYYW